MSWHITGTCYGICNCQLGCPCTLGALEGDFEWCSGGQIYEIKAGNVDGVDVGGAKVAWIADWPSGFLSGGGTGRLYIDPDVPAEQLASLESLFQGRQGGTFEAIGVLIPTFLPTTRAPITIHAGNDEARITVGEVGEAVVKLLRGASGELTRLLHGAAAINDDIILANGRGSRWHDPEMRPWESAGEASLAEFDWRA
jgi:hypothetical protein